MFLDESIRGHEISPHTQAAVVQPELDGGSVRYFDDTLLAYGVLSTTGSWGVDGSGGFGNDAARGTSGSATYRVELPAGTCSLAVTWEAAPELSAAVDVAVVVGSDAAVATTLDQTAAPEGVTAADAVWQVVWSGEVASTTVSSTTLSGTGGGDVRVDGLRVACEAPASSEAALP